MGSMDSLTELANALETFFKGLSECGLVTTYSVQLQVATVDFVVQIKFHCLMYHFMKSLQVLLLKTKIPGHESSYDVAVQTPSDFNFVFNKVKQNEANERVTSDELGSLVEACVFEKDDREIEWTAPDTSSNFKDGQNTTFVVQSNENNTSSNIIVACHTATLAAIATHSIVASAEPVIEDRNVKKLDLSCDNVNNFRTDLVNNNEVISVNVSEDNLNTCENNNDNSNTCKENFVEIESSNKLETVDKVIDHGNLKALHIEENPLILKTYVEEHSVSMGDTMNIMHIVVASENPDSKQSTKQDKDKKKTFKCKDCEKSFTSIQSLEMHLTRKHAAKEQCDMCPRSFSSIQSLQEHCRLEHGGMGCFNCLVCSRRFMTKLSYKRHMDTHVGKKEAVCDMCGKTFSRADYLNKHYMTHSGARPLSCSQCPRKFISSSHLKNHEKTHTGEREHACKLCPKSFSRADKLKEHTLRHLNIKRFQCPVCKRTYAEKRDLTKHMRAHDK